VALLPPVTIKLDDDTDNSDLTKITNVSHWPKCPPSPTPAMINLDTITPTEFTKSLKDMNSEDLAKLLFNAKAPSAPSILDAESKRKAPVPLTCIDKKVIMAQLHQSDTSPPPIRPCDTPNPSNIKSHWTAKELHHITGCQGFRNYRHLLYVSKDGTYINNGKFPTSIGAYTTIPKAP
jgi:hypothetical protein